MNESTDPRTLQALRLDRAAPPPDGVQTRIASRLGIAGRLPGGSAGSAPPGSAEIRVARTTAMLALTFLAGGAAGMLLHARLASHPAPGVIDVNTPAPAVSSAMAPPTMPVPRGVPPSVIDSAGIRPPAPTAVATPPPDARLTQLDAERALLDSARGALVGGDSDAALRALQRHEKTFRRPLLGEEHDALVVQALVEAGRYDQARSLAAEFKGKFPRSMLLPAVDAAIATIR
jgi:hypothetical protein